MGVKSDFKIWCFCTKTLKGFNFRSLAKQFIAFSANLVWMSDSFVYWCTPEISLRVQKLEYLVVSYTEWNGIFQTKREDLICFGTPTLLSGGKNCLCSIHTFFENEETLSYLFRLITDVYCLTYSERADVAARATCSSNASAGFSKAGPEREDRRSGSSMINPSIIRSDHSSPPPEKLAPPKKLPLSALYMGW